MRCQTNRKHLGCNLKEHTGKFQEAKLFQSCLLWKWWESHPLARESCVLQKNIRLNHRTSLKKGVFYSFHHSVYAPPASSMSQCYPGIVAQS